MKLRKFCKSNYNALRLKPKKEDIELNKCTHIIDEKDNKCKICGKYIPTDVQINELIANTEKVINHLELYKMVIYTSGTRKEIKASQKYFKMIPLLKNIKSLHDICDDCNDRAKDQLQKLSDNLEDTFYDE